MGRTAMPSTARAAALPAQAVVCALSKPILASVTLAGLGQAASTRCVLCKTAQDMVCAPDYHSSTLSVSAARPMSVPTAMLSAPMALGPTVLVHATRASRALAAT